MAFIVGMWWRRPHQIIVQDVDDSGELYVSSVIPNGAPDPERRTFACSAWNWTAAQDLARTFGWQPKGPLFHRWRPKNAPTVRIDSYKPDGWINGIHEVGADDALAWAQALESSLHALDLGTFDLPDVTQPALLRDAMSLNDFRPANRGFTPQFLGAFASFMAKGPFKFGWDD